MGKGGGGTNTVTSNQAPPQYVQDAYLAALNKANMAAALPYSQYSGQTVAGLAPSQIGAINNIEGAQGSAQPYINNANSMIQSSQAPLWNSVQQFSPEAIASYSSPYTKQVVDATMAQAHQNDAIQQNGLIGNAISKGAWGGDRAGIAQAVLAGQQDLANNQTVAALNNQGYSQALGEFNQQQQGQLGANQANAWLAQQGAFGEANLGNETQTSKLAGAAAEMQAGSLEQQQTQAELNVPYEQYLAQQAYPFQTAQYIANITEGIGGSSGGTSSTQSPGANPTSQGIGTAASLGTLGYLGYLALSDRRVKENIKKIGKYKGKNGTYPVYTYNYKGDKTPQIGVMAQDVEKIYPDAVREINKIKHVYYQKLKTGGRVKLATGGLVPDLSVSFIPNASAPTVRNTIPNAPKAYQESDTNSNSLQNLGTILSAAKLAQGDPSSIIGGQNDLSGGGLSALDSETKSFNSFTPSASSSMGNFNLSADGITPTIPDGFDTTSPFAGFAPKFADGGDVQPQFGGIAPNGNQYEQAQYSNYAKQDPEKLREMAARIPANSPQGQLLRKALMQKQIMPNAGGNTQAPMAGGIAGPQAPQTFADGGDVDENEDSIESNDLSPASAQTAQANDTPSNGGLAQAVTSDPEKQKKMEAVLPILAAGLGMMAGQSPNAVTNIGTGALKGLDFYAKQKSADATAKHLADQADIAKQKIADEKEYRTNELGYRNKALESEDQYRKGELGYHNKALGLEAEKIAKDKYQYFAGEGLDENGNKVNGTYRAPVTGEGQPVFIPNVVMGGINRRGAPNPEDVNKSALYYAQKDPAWSNAQTPEAKQKILDIYGNQIRTGKLVPVVNKATAETTDQPKSLPNDPLGLGIRD